ncbi:MAG: alpha/beta hydrolase [Rhodospirillaceae bacterium]|nr:alpha/beta hydrolase [Rhodospirillaceae bacterium]|tara:strand:- start:50858 stop:51718 length:861 start_codon:yes stop_codon:yes gene_type:complete
MTDTFSLGDTRVRIDGEGPDVVLVHGVGCDLHMWDDLFPGLADRYRVIRYDTLGHGETSLPSPDITLKDYADQLDAVRSGLGLSRFALVGFSMGVPISQLFAIGNSADLAGLVLMSGVYDRAPDQVKAIQDRIVLARSEGTSALMEAALERWLSPEFRAARPDAEARIRQRFADNPPENFLTAYKIFAEADPWVVGKIGAITCPTLTTTGEDDPGSRPSMSRAMADEIPNARYAGMPGLRHMPMVERPDVVRDLLLGFLDGLPRDGVVWSRTGLPQAHLLCRSARR